MPSTHSLPIAGLLLGLALADVSGQAMAPEPTATRRGAPIGPVSAGGDPWLVRLDKAEKASQKPEAVVDILEKPTFGDAIPPAEACDLLANAYIAMGRYEDAETVLRHGLKARPKSKLLLAAQANLDFLLGRVRLDEGVYREAKIYFEKALEGAPAGVPGRPIRERIAAAYREAARSLEATGDHDRAIGVLKESLELDPDHPASIRLLGNVLKSAGRTKDAISFFELYLMYLPDDREMKEELVELYKEVGDDAKAAELSAKLPKLPAEEAVEPKPQSPEHEEETELAAELAAAKDDKSRSELHLQRARGLAAKKDYKGATDEYREALERDPGNRTATLGLADALRHDRKVPEAWRLYEDLLTVDEKDHEARFLLAKMLAATGKPKEALGHLKRLAIEPALDKKLLVDSYNWLGIAYAQTGEYGPAEDAWREVLRVDPRHANAHYNIGQVHEKRSRRPEAIAAFEKAVEHGEADPDYLRYLERLAAALRSAGRAKDSRDILTRLGAMAQPGSPQAQRVKELLAEPVPVEETPEQRVLAATGGEAELLQSAEREFKAGRLEEAIRHYEQAVAANPANAETYFKLGDLLHQRGEWAREKALFESMLAQKLTPQMQRAARYRLEGISR